MCSITESCLSKDMESIDIKKNDLVYCKKCLIEKSFVVLQKRHSYCRTCFHILCSHKFRSTIGKTKMIKRGHQILIGFSGGSSSVALVNLVKEGLNEDNSHRKLTFVPSILHVDESYITPTVDVTSELKRLTLETSWPCYIIHISDCFRGKRKPCAARPDEYKKPDPENPSVRKIVESFESLKSQTSKDELLRRIRTQLIVDFARDIGMNGIFLSSSGTRLAGQLITDVAQGKGNQIHLETGFCDNRYDIPLFKPMREFVSKEIAFYNSMMSLNPLTRTNLGTLKDKKVSLGKASEAFVTSLECDFPATIYTVCKISTKITSSKDDSVDLCKLCKSKNDTKNMDQCSALSALQISRCLSKSSTQELRHDLCYACQNMFRESSSTPLQHLLVDRNDQKKEIEEFILVDDAE